MYTVFSLLHTCTRTSTVSFFFITIHSMHVHVQYDLPLLGIFYTFSSRSELESPPIDTAWMETTSKKAALKVS